MLVVSLCLGTKSAINSTWNRNSLSFSIQEMQLNEHGHNCGIRHVTVPIATRILIANVRHIGLSNICVINLIYFKMQV